MSSSIRLVFKSYQDKSKIADFIHEFICCMRSVNITGETQVSIDYHPKLSYNIGYDGTIEVVYVPREDISIDITTCDNDESV